MVEPRTRDEQRRRRDSTGHGGGSNLLLWHHSRERGGEKGTRLGDEGMGRGKRAATSESQTETEGGDACLVSGRDCVEVDVSFDSFPPPQP